MHPHLGKSLHNGMLSVSRDDCKLVLTTVTSATAWALVDNLFTRIVQVNVGTRFFISSPPTTESNHAVEFGPIAKRVVCSMHNDKPSPSGNILFKSCVGFVWPLGRIEPEVRNDNLILGEIGFEVRIGFGCFERFSLDTVVQRILLKMLFTLPCIFCTSNIHCVSFGVLKILFHHRCRFWPRTVVVLAIDDQGTNGGLSFCESVR